MMVRAAPRPAPRPAPAKVTEFGPVFCADAIAAKASTERNAQLAMRIMFIRELPCRGNRSWHVRYRDRRRATRGGSVVLRVGQLHAHEQRRQEGEDIRLEERDEQFQQAQ